MFNKALVTYIVPVSRGDPLNFLFDAGYVLSQTRIPGYW